MPELVTRGCDHHYDPLGGCEGVYDATGVCDQCGRPPLSQAKPSQPRRRVRWDLEGGHMDICVSPDASPETVEALHDLGQAAVNHLRKEAMTWTISMTGHDDLTGDEKVAYEEGLVEKAKALAAELGDADGGRITTASATTNTTGSVNLLAEATEGS